MPTSTHHVEPNQYETNSLLARLLALSYVDQDVDIREIELIYTIALERGVSKEALEEIMLRPHMVDVTLPAEPAGRISHLYDLARLVMADGIIKDEERSMLKQTVLRYEFDEENADDIVAFLLEHASQKTDSFEVIQLVQAAV